MPCSFERTTNNVTAYVRRLVRLNYVRTDGSSLKQRNEKARRQLENPSTPESLKASLKGLLDQDTPQVVNTYEQWLLGRFWELHSGRGSNNHGPETLSFADITAFCEVMGEDLEPVEVGVIKAIDNAYLDAVFTERSNEHT